MVLIVEEMRVYVSLRGLYKKYPKAFSFVELAIYTALFVFNVWIVPFWFWGIYRLNITFPEGLKPLFYKLWHGTVFVGLISIILGLLFFVLSSLIRRDSLKQLGIRFDNLYKSGRECAVIFLASIGMILLLSIFYADKSYPHGVISYLAGFFKHTPWGITRRITEGLAQQFFLQGVFLIRFLQIFEKKSISLMTAALLFSVAHSPNIRLMFLSFFFGLIVCILFLRNRNIFTLGIMHGVLSMTFISFLVPGLVGDFKIGPWRDNTEFIASIEYHGRPIETKPSHMMVVPVSVTNKSTATWDSKDKDHPVLSSYHLLNAKGEMVEYDNIRTSFHKTIETDVSVFVDLMVNAPSKKGDYYLEVDMVKEKVAWFKSKGSKTMLIPLSVK
jgi:hypothetical protein